MKNNRELAPHGAEGGYYIKINGSMVWGWYQADEPEW